MGRPSATWRPRPRHPSQPSFENKSGRTASSLKSAFVSNSRQRTTMVSIYSFGKPLSLPDIDEDTDGEDVGIYLEAACMKCHKYAKSIEAMTEQVDNLQSLLAHREHHLKVIKMRAKRAKFTFFSLRGCVRIRARKKRCA